MERSYTLLLVDDDARMRKAVGDFLSMNGYRVLFAENGQAAVDLFYAKTDEIDLILLDVMMPQMDGVAVLRELRGCSQVPIIMLTAKSAEEDELAGLGLGADDYIAKPFAPKLLLARIQTVLRRSWRARGQKLTVGALTLDTDTQQAAIGGTPLELTPKEYDLLLFFVSHLGQALDRGRILNAVWNFDYAGDGRTVDTHVKQLRAKLTAAYPYIKTVHRVGYRFEV